MPVELKPVPRSLFCKGVNRIIDKVTQTLGPRVCVDEATNKPLVVLVGYEYFKGLQDAYVGRDWKARVCKHCGEPFREESPDAEVDGESIHPSLIGIEEEDKWEDWDEEEILGDHIAKQIKSL